MPSSSFSDPTENDFKFLPTAPWLIKHKSSAMEEHTKKPLQEAGWFPVPWVWITTILLSNAGQGPGETEVYKQNLGCRCLPDHDYDSWSIATFPVPTVRHRHFVCPCEAQANRTQNAAGWRPPKEKARLPQEGSWTALWRMSFLWQS